MDRRYNVLQKGLEFEDEIIITFREWVSQKGNLSLFFVTRDTEIDRCAGTDFIAEGIPFDATFAFDVKNNIAESTTITDEFCDIKIGLRTGNGTVSFYTPVIVVGVTMEPLFISQYMDRVVCAIKRHLDQIIDVSMDMFYTYCDEYGKDPEYIYQTAKTAKEIIV